MLTARDDAIFNLLLDMDRHEENITEESLAIKIYGENYTEEQREDARNSLLRLSEQGLIGWEEY